MDPLGFDQRYALITRRLETQNGWSAQKLQQLLVSGKTIKYQWATAPTGKPHIGYFIPLIKFADFIRAGGEVVVELVDTYAFLVNYKFPWEQVCRRADYYKALIVAALRAIGVPVSGVSTAKMSSYQGNDRFLVDFWKLCAVCAVQDVRDTGAEVGESTMLSPLLTPLLQELGEEYLDVDVQVGGTDQVRQMAAVMLCLGFVRGDVLTGDQRGIFNLGEQFLPELGYEKRVHLMNALLPGLTGGKMSSSHPAFTKIMFLDDAETVRAKIAGAACPARVVEGNGILPIVEHILFPASEIRMLDLDGQGRHDGAGGVVGPNAAERAPAGTLFSVSDAGGSRNYSTYGQLEGDYVAGLVEPEALKTAVAEAVDGLLRPIREAYSVDDEWKVADREGYPEDWARPEGEIE